MDRSRTIEELNVKSQALLKGALARTGAAALAAALVPVAALAPSTAHATAVAVSDCSAPGGSGGGLIVAQHCTDGGFNLHNSSFPGGGLQNSDALEWGGPNVSKTFFPRGDGLAGGAWLYADQGQSLSGQNKLYLMYDYADPAPGFGGPNSFFDVFFEIKPDNEDYLVQISPGLNQLTVFTKPLGAPSLVNPDGTFDTGAPWVLATPDDLALAGFQGATGFGVSPNNATPHAMAEFELTVNQLGFANPPPGATPGLYDPSPAFWSASVGNPGGFDPPISSRIFTLDPNGGTSVTPVLGPNGPILQPIPEPNSVSLVGVGVLALCGIGCSRRSEKH